MAITLNGTTGIATPGVDAAGNMSYTGTLTGSTGILNIGSGQIYKSAAGLVGIGTVAPAAKLHIGGNAATSAQAILATGVSDPNFQLWAINGNAGVVTNTRQASFGLVYSGVGYSSMIHFIRGGSTSDGALAIETNGLERARIDGNGTLLLGTTSAGGGNLLTVQGSITAGHVAEIRSSNWWEVLKLSHSSTGAACFIRYDKNPGAFWDAGASPDSTPSFLFRTNGVDKAIINWTTGAYSAVSDRRLKENIIAIQYGLTEIMSLTPVTYNIIGDETQSPQIGLIAQDVLPTVPEVVSVPTDIDEGRYAMNYAGLVPVLIKAIQEQQEIINTLKARLDAAGL